MPLATLKEKGQITLPAAIRRKLHAAKGDIFNFEFVSGKVVMTLQKLVPAKNDSKKARAKKLDISKYIGIANGTFGSVEEIDEYIRNERASWD